MGEGMCFYIASFGYLAMVIALFLVQVAAVQGRGRGSMWGELVAGVSFVARRPVFSSLIGMTFFNSIFGMSSQILMPIFAKDILDAGSEGLGFLMSAGGVGGLLGTLTVASLGNFRRRGWLILSGSAVYGLTLILFAFSRSYPLSLGLLTLSGYVNFLYMTTTNTTLQFLVPDELRGRVMGLYSLTWSLFSLGGLQAGAVATLLGATAAVALGGAAVSAFSLGVGARFSAVRRA